jgi:TonB family protein
MNEFALYLFKSSCWLTGFALVYMLFLRNERFFLLKRVFLISGILVSIIFPLFSFHYSVEVQTLLMSSFYQGENLLPVSSIRQEIPVSNAVNQIDFRKILLVLYLTGLFVVGVKLFHGLFQILKSIYNHKISDKSQVTIIRSSEYPSSFSFFNYVFINPSIEENDLREIMNHELIHVKQKHWFDLLLAELIRMLQWANPFAWIYTRFIRLNHEYLADEGALRSSSDPAFYKVALLNQMYNSPVLSLSNSFNYSINKNRFEMMEKIFTSPYRKLKVFLVIPVFAILFYAFAEPEFSYQGPNKSVIQLTQSSVVKEVRGTVLKKEGTPFQGVQIAVTGTEIRGITDSTGNFTLAGVPEGSHIIFSCRGHLTQVLKPQYTGTMKVQLLKDPEYSAITVPASLQNAVVVIDNVISDKPYSEAAKEIYPEDIARMSRLQDKEAIDKYGDKGKNGVVEIITRKNAASLGIKVPFRRENPEDYPTFRGESYRQFGNWLADNIKYPESAVARGGQGRVTANYSIQSDGTINNTRIIGSPDDLLAEVVLKAINESPRWEPAKNSEAREPFSTSVTIKFTLPDRITLDDTYIVVDQMPEYPGGDIALLDFLKNNVRYPEGARADKAEGRVIVRFIVNTKGKVEDVVVLKGVHPLLDAEALRVVNLLSGWLPGAQGGKPVNVWYMVPVTFGLSEPVLQR